LVPRGGPGAPPALLGVVTAWVAAMVDIGRRSALHRSSVLLLDPVVGAVLPLLGAGGAGAVGAEVAQLQGEVAALEMDLRGEVRGALLARLLGVLASQRPAGSALVEGCLATVPQVGERPLE